MLLYSNTRLLYVYTLQALLFVVLFIWPGQINSQKEQKLFIPLSPAQTGITFRNDVEDTVAALDNGGVSIGDINNDGLPDILLTGNQNPPKLYLNLGGMKFKDITDAAGLGKLKGVYSGSNIVDADGDGWNDIFLCKVSGDKKKLLLHNNHNLTFTDNAADLKLNDSNNTLEAIFFDFNNDGLLDILLENFSTYPKRRTMDVGYYKDSLISDATGPKLLINRGDHYEDITSSTGLGKQSSLTNSAAVCDFDFDGYPDILLCNDFILPELLYRNVDGTSLENVTTKYFKHSSLFSMGCDYGDINNDGIPDIITLDMLPNSYYRTKNNMSNFSYKFYNLLHTKIKPAEYISNTLFLGSVSPPFADAAHQAGIARTDWSWSPLIQDFDNDGWNDVYITQGTTRELMALDHLNVMTSTNEGSHYSFDPDEDYQSLPVNKRPNFFYHNEGNLSFKDYSAQWGFADSLISFGAAYADLDSDGDLDLVVNRVNDFAVIYENRANKILKNHFIRFKLEGNNKNTAGLGAFVRIFYDHNAHVEYLGNAHGYESTSEPIVHFGLGNAKMIDSVECYWPGGDYQVLRKLRADSVYTIHQHTGKKKIYHPDIVNQSLFREVYKTDTPVVHHENYYVDFKRDRLQPFQLSAEGPSIAVGDVNNDSLDDFYIGGAKGSAGQLWIQRKDGTFYKSEGQPWQTDSTIENQGCVIADFNKDGWNDLLVADGSGENVKGDKGNVLKLYLNDGKGHFTDASDRIPQKDICYSSISVCDFNKDGYLDILAGGRLSPEAYPMPTTTRLLVNHQGTFVDETQTLAPDLINIGNVRSAIWSDYDNDGLQDIVIAGEWMPIKFLHNEQGSFKLIGGNPEIDSAFGLWSNIIQADFNHNGRMDYIACNYGTNSYLKASHDEPVTLYYGDFDDNGINEPLVFHYIHDTMGILYDRNTLCEQMPKFQTKFLTFKKFAQAHLEDFMTADKMKTAVKFTLNEMRSCYIENLGNGKFKMKPLPIDCQLSAMYSALPADVNGDGNTDVVMIGNGDINLYQYTPMDATSGVVLINDGHGNFKALLPDESGFKNPGYGRCLEELKGAKNELLILAANNNDTLRFFKLTKPQH